MSLVPAHIFPPLWAAGHLPHQQVDCFLSDRGRSPSQVLFFRLQATCLIETLPAAFEMDEILFELREHSAGLNCGRWDYIFSFIKTLKQDPQARHA